MFHLFSSFQFMNEHKQTYYSFIYANFRRSEEPNYYFLLLKIVIRLNHSKRKLYIFCYYI